jgi:uncharacterized tellurite resistance protein B-like protein
MGGTQVDWPNFAKRLILADGQISEREADILKRAVLSDAKVDHEEVEFLVQLKREAAMVHPAFDRFLFEVLKRVVMADGVISDDEARWLRKTLFADNQTVRAETDFVKDLHREAKSFGKEFEQLWKDCSHLQQSDFIG